MKETLNYQEIEQALRNQMRILQQRLESDPRTDSKGQLANPNRADLARSYQENYRSSLLQARAQEQLAAVDQALRRLANGTYGKCTSCGQPIEKERLDVIPSVSFCIDCQQAENE